jgi:hypothetical protein
MMKIVGSWISTAVFLSLSSSVLAGGDKSDVRCHFAPGKYVMTTTEQSEGTTTIAGTKMPEKEQAKYVWQLDVSAPNGNDEKKMSLRLVEARMEGEEQGEAYRYDTAGRNEPKGQRAFDFAYRALLGATITVALDADDTVVEVSGFDKLWNSLGEKAQTEAEKAIVTTMKLSMNDKSMEAGLRRLESLMPKKAVAVGETWKAGLRIDMPRIGEIKVRYDCKLGALENGDGGPIAVIEAAANYDLSSPKTTKIEGVDLTLNKITMKEQATLKVQLKTGVVVLDESHRTSKVEGKFSKDGQEGDLISDRKANISTVITPGEATKPAAEKNGEPKPKTSQTPKAKKASKSDKPTTVLRRQWEPTQKAFTILVPEGWTIVGGMFAVDPLRGGGPLNSVETKCDLTVKRDAAGTVMARWAPSYNYVDFLPNGEYATLAALFPAGKVYKGALSKPLPTVEDFLTEGFQTVRPEAEDVRVTQRLNVPEIVESLTKLTQGTNANTAALGKPPMTFTAGGLVWEYRENGVEYREAAFTAIYDWRAASGLWGNQFTFHMRTPAAEADDWKPLLDSIRQSIEFNPEWVAAYQKALGQRGADAVNTMRYLARVDREIYEHRAKTNAEIRHEDYLLLTGQEEYVNPYTKKAEQDTSAHPYRWTNAKGDRLYSDKSEFDPNRDPAFDRDEWKLTPIRQR